MWIPAGGSVEDSNHKLQSQLHQADARRLWRSLTTIKVKSGAISVTHFYYISSMPFIPIWAGKQSFTEAGLPIPCWLCPMHLVGWNQICIHKGKLSESGMTRLGSWTYSETVRLSSLSSLISSNFQFNGLPDLIIIPIPKNNKVTCFNDYQPVALTSAVVKCFERFVMAHVWKGPAQSRSLAICIQEKWVYRGHHLSCISFSSGPPK